jgi:hypothetical protein
LRRRKQRARRQRVMLRSRRREVLKHRLRNVLWKSVAFAVAAGFFLGMVAGGDSYFARFMRQHTPGLVVSAPQAMAGLPLLQELPARRFLLWFPGTGNRAIGRIMQKYPEVRNVRFERRFQENKIIMQVEPRTPLVRWNDRGLDGEGVVFRLGPGSWTHLPQVSVGADLPAPLVGRWLAELSRSPAVWGNVVAVRDGHRGQVLLMMNTGVEVEWGEPEIGKTHKKAEWLAKVLQDAHEHLGGAAHADLRFFDEGRIIVKPKSVRS